MNNGIFYEMLTYPLSRSQYLLGKVLFNLLLAIFQAGATVGLAWAILGVRVHGELLPLLFLGVVGGTAGWFFFYTIFALRIRRNDLFNTVTSPRASRLIAREGLTDTFDERNTRPAVASHHKWTDSPNLFLRRWVL